MSAQKIATLAIIDLCDESDADRELRLAREREERNAKIYAEFTDDITAAEKQGEYWWMEVETGEGSAGALCVLETEDWKPKAGDTVKFVRYPNGFDRSILHATLVS